MLEYTQTYHAVLNRDGSIVRWSEGGPPILHPTEAKAAKSCTEDGQRVIAVRLRWKANPPTPDRP